jgi:hypothetical protein
MSFRSRRVFAVGPQRAQPEPLLIARRQSSRGGREPSKGRGAYLARYVYYRTMLYKHGSHLHVPPVCCLVQWRVAALRHPGRTPR